MSDSTTQLANPELSKFASSVLDFVDVTGRAVQHGHAASVAMSKQAAAAEERAPKLADLMVANRQIATGERDAAVKLASTYEGVCDLLNNAVTALAVANTKLASFENSTKLEIGTPVHQTKKASASGVGELSPADKLMMDYAERFTQR